MARNEDEPHADDYADGRKRRRTKKPRDDDDWMPAPALTGRVTAGIDPMQLSHVTSMPVPPLMPISSHSSSAVRISNLTTVESPSMAVMPVSSASSTNASSVFQELPNMIQSFTETERRRKNGGTNSSAASMSALIHASSSSSINKNGSSGSTRSSRTGEPERVATQGTSNGAGRHASLHPISVMDLLFGDSYSSAKANGSDSGMNGSAKQPLKRKRRSDASSQRSSRRSARDEDRGSSRDYDLLRFGVDSVKLVPQGLVDRVDDTMSRAFISRIIQNHVENWIKRAGFGDSFLPEITTLLTAYYPCSYPTILDEVLVGFLFKRPEFIDTLLKTMLEKVHKAGESATANRYPVIHAFSRRCRPMRSRGAEKARHDFACTTLLRYLVENNTEKCMLSPWIAACAMHCSANVINDLWCALLNAWETQPETKKSVNTQWAAQNSVQQAYELLLEEKQRLSSVGAGECPLSTALVRIMLLDPAYKKMAVEANPFIVQEAVEIFFAHANHRTSNEILMSATKNVNVNTSQRIEELLSFVAQAASKLSVKKTNWFSYHVLRFALTIPDVEAAEKIITTVLCHYMPLVFGGIDNEELETCIELTIGIRKLSNADNESSSKSLGGGLDVSWDVFRLVEHHKVIDTVEKLRYLLELLVISGETRDILLMKLWSKIWSNEQYPVVLPWSYVLGLLNVAVDGSIARDDILQSRILVQTFQSLVEQVCTSYFKLLIQTQKADGFNDQVITRFTEALLLVLPSEHPVARSLLHCIVGHLCHLPKGFSASIADTIFRNAVSIYLSGATVDSLASINDVNKQQTKDVEGLDEASHVSQPADHCVIMSLLGLASLENDTGKFVRRQLSSRCMVQMLIGLLSSEERSFKIPTLLNLITEVIARGTDTTFRAEWMRQHVIHDIVHCAYNGGDVESSSAVALLQLLSASSVTKSVDGREVILWVIVRRCTKLCCGCAVSSADEATVMKFYSTATLFAEFVKTMLISSRDAMDKIAKYIEQEMWTCSSGATQMNIFLLLLLQKLSFFGLEQSTNCISVIQLAVSPICSLDRVRIIQLQFLKALCCRLGALKRTKFPNGSSIAMDNWKRCEDLLCNTRLQADLREIIAASSSTSSQTAIMLAEGILNFTVELKQRRQP